MARVDLDPNPWTRMSVVRKPCENTKSKVHKRLYMAWVLLVCVCVWGVRFGGIMISQWTVKEMVLDENFIY